MVQHIGVDPQGYEIILKFNLLSPYNLKYESIKYKVIIALCFLHIVYQPHSSRKHSLFIFLSIHTLAFTSILGFEV